jgi:hypothetical protein
MSTIELKAHVGKDGIVTLQLPPDFEDGDVTITVSRAEPAPTVEDVPWEDRPWTKEEIAELMKSNPMTLGEILQSESVGSWADLGIEDSQAWVDEVRRQEAERRRWPRE